MDAQAIIDDAVERLRQVPGVECIVLGGSRARGTHTPQSDIDLAIYYWPQAPLDIDAVQRIAEQIEDNPRPGIVTPIGEWGPWINGGGWLTVQGTPVDFLYRDLQSVTSVVEQCCAGHVEIWYQPGHPHGFVTEIYLAEVALCKTLWDPNGALLDLKARANPYPPPLKRAIVDTFFWEAHFALRIAEKGLPRLDTSYIAGCAFRGVSCLMQALFALNEHYWMNEKGAVALADSFPRKPDRLAARVERIFTHLPPHEADLTSALRSLKDLIDDTGQLLAAEGLHP